MCSFLLHSLSVSSISVSHIPTFVCSNTYDLAVNRYFGILQYVSSCCSYDSHQMSLTRVCQRLSFVMSLLADVWDNDACKRKTLMLPNSIISADARSLLDVYLWEPVGALISTVLSQMILGARVYAVRDPPLHHRVPGLTWSNPSSSMVKTRQWALCCPRSSSLR